MAKSSFYNLGFNLSMSTASLKKAADESKKHFHSMSESAKDFGTDMLKSLAGIAGVGLTLEGAFKIIEDGFNATGEGADKAEKLIYSFKTTLSELGSDLVNTSGLYSNLLDTIAAAGKYKETEDFLSKQDSYYQVRASGLQARIAELRAKRAQGIVLSKEEAAEEISTSKELYLVQKSILEGYVQAKIDEREKIKGIDAGIFNDIEDGVKQKSELYGKELLALDDKRYEEAEIYKKQLEDVSDANERFKKAIEDARTHNTVAQTIIGPEGVPTTEMALNEKGFKDEINAYLRSLTSAERATIAEESIIGKDDFAKLIQYWVQIGNASADYSANLRSIARATKELKTSTTSIKPLSTYLWKDSTDTSSISPTQQRKMLLASGSKSDGFMSMNKNSTSTNQYVVNATNSIKSMGDEFDKVKDKEASFWDEFSSKADAASQGIQSLGDAFKSLGDMIGGAGGTIVSFVGTAISSFASLGSQYVQLYAQAFGTGAMEALSSGARLPFPYNLVAMGTALASFMSLAASIPKLADGGLAYGNSIVNVGEYSGARSNPEVIAPLSKLKDIISVGNGSGSVDFRIKGDDLVSIHNKRIKARSKY